VAPPIHAVWLIDQAPQIETGAWRIDDQNPHAFDDHLGTPVRILVLNAEQQVRQVTKFQLGALLKRGDPETPSGASVPIFCRLKLPAIHFE
jgi:hypothetical protein